MERRNTPLWVKLAFVIYAAAMLWLLFGQRLGYPRVSYGEYFDKNVILTPFLTIKRFTAVLKNGSSSYRTLHAFVNLVGNVIMFVPLGVFWPLIRRRKLKFFRCMLECVIIIAAVELIQLFAMLGTCDIDDLILNLAGAAIGYMILKLLEIKRKE